MRLCLILLLGLLALPLHGAEPREEDKTEQLLQEVRELKGMLQVFMDQANRRFEELRQDIDKRFEQVDKRFEQIDKRFEQVERQFDRMMTFLWILAAIFTSMVAVVIGWAYWDRRTIIRRAREETLEYLERRGLVEEVRRLRAAMQDLAREEPKIARVLQKHGLL